MTLKRRKQPVSRQGNACHWHHWHIASFRCAAEFGRNRGIADIDQAAPIKLDL
jgi:hypothetical protein